MTHQMSVTLTDDEYVALAAEAERTGKEANLLLREAVAKQFLPHTWRHSGLSAYYMMEHLCQAGVIDGIPTGERNTAEEAAKRKHLARVFGQEAPLSENVIEDRGPF